MKCIKCGSEISNNYASCPNCGTSRAESAEALNMNGAFINRGDSFGATPGSNYCRVCGRSIPDGYNMCPECTSGRAGMPGGAMPSKNNTVLIIAAVIAAVMVLCSTVFVLAWTNGAFDNSDGKEETVAGEITGNSGESTEELKRKAEEEARLKIEEEARIKAEAEAKVKAEEEAKRKAELEAKEASRYVGYNPGYAITWEGAVSAAQQKGGHLACPNSPEEFERIRQAAVKAGLRKIWLGVKRTGNSWYTGLYCTDGSGSIGYNNWLPGEPSDFDKEKYEKSGIRIEERYLMALLKNGVWYINDVANDVSYAYKDIGYVVEKWD